MKSKLFRKVVSMVTCGVVTMGMMVTSAVAAPGATIDPSTPVTLTIHKLTPKPVDGKPGDGTETNAPGTGLPGVQFKISSTNIPIAPGDKTAANVTAADVTADEVAYGVTEVKTVTTGADGTVLVEGLKQGVYLVQELSHPGVTAAAPDFLVSLPMTNPTGDGWNYNVHVYPKNDIVDGPSIDKDVKLPGNDHTSVNVGDQVEWIIRPQIPKELYYMHENKEEVYAKQFQITDNINSALKYVKENPVFKVNDKVVNLTLNTDYTCALAGEDAKGQGGTLTIALTQSGMKKVVTAAGYIANPESALTTLDISFKTEVTKDALNVDSITNNATLDYTNSFGSNFKPTVPAEKVPEVHTGSTGLKKFGKDTNAALAGAQFKIASSLENAKAGHFMQIDANGRVTEWSASNQGSDYTVTSGADGIVKFQGLAFDNQNVDGQKSYWIVETLAPTGYELLKAPFEVQVVKNSTANTQVGTVSVYNAKKFTLPITGGTGTGIFLIGGMSLIALAGALMVVAGKNKRA